MYTELRFSRFKSEPRHVWKLLGSGNLESFVYTTYIWLRCTELLAKCMQTRKSGWVMKASVKKCAYVLALCVGLVSATLIACGNDPLESKPKQKASAAPVAFTEQRKLAAANTSDDFKGGVILPKADEVTLHGKEVTGGLPAVMTFLDERQTGLNYIYKKFSALKPGFEGEMTLDITVDVCGDVKNITEISSTTENPQFNTEIKNSLAKQKYPTTDQGNYTISLSLTFVKDLNPESGDVPSKENSGAESPKAQPKGPHVVLPAKKDVIVQGKIAGGAPALLKFLEKHSSLVNNIYNKALKSNSGIAGQLSLNVTVDPGGDIFRIFVDSTTTGSASFDLTLKNSIARWKFPDSEQGRYTVIFPLTFVQK